MVIEKINANDILTKCIESTDDDFKSYILSLKNRIIMGDKFIVFEPIEGTLNSKDVIRHYDISNVLELNTYFSEHIKIDSKFLIDIKNL